MNYIKLFNTHAEYEAAQSSLILPNVSFCKDTPNEVHYNPSSPVPPTPTHDYVEIGGLKWATMNVGANSVTDYGLYFQWGDTQGYTAAQVGTDKVFNWANYKYGGNDSGGQTKYNETDGNKVLEASDDAVMANWGGSWRMPTEADFQALSAATNNTWTSITVDNVTVNGRLFTDKTDPSKTLFFPAAGRFAGGSVYSVGSNGGYWSSSLSTNKVANGRMLGFEYGGCYMYNSERYLGRPVRGVIADS